MRGRGRPPHPDILTPREWQVLGLLRLRLTNEEIGERLGISADGAKYHVSQILSKLGVGTRDEAASWQPAAGAPWWTRLLALPAAKIAAAAVVLAALGGLGVLAWAVLRTPTLEGDFSFDAESLPAPAVSPTLTRDQALITAARYIEGFGMTGDLRLALTTSATAKQAARDTGYGPMEPPGGAATWLASFHVLANACGHGPACAGEATPYGARTTCREIIVFFLDNPAAIPGQVAGAFSSTGPPLDDALCRRGVLPRDMAVIDAARAADAYLHERTPDTAAAELTTAGEALSAVKSRAGPLKVIMDRPAESQVWLVTLHGRTYDALEPSPAPETPHLTCHDIFGIPDAAPGETLLQAFAAADSCL